jgi:hypothetical protein
MSLLIKDFDRNIHEKFSLSLVERGFKYLSEGRYRETYKRGNIVIKIPINDLGFGDNVMEAYAYRKFHKETPNEKEIFFAPCRLLSNGCLMMVYVETFGIELPPWTENIDCQQCGSYEGRIVCYDAACDIEWLRSEALDTQYISRSKIEGEVNVIPR